MFCRSFTGIVRPHGLAFRLLLIGNAIIAWHVCGKEHTAVSALSEQHMMDSCLPATASLLQAAMPRY